MKKGSSTFDIGPSTMPAKIIVNADDLGLCPSVNAAIFEVFRAGNLGSATLMVNMPGTADAVEGAKVHSALAIGLHFCITEGKAVAGPSSLTDPQGRFMSRSELVKALLRRRVHARDVQHELAAQLARMKEFGIMPTHVDSHQHVHMLPTVLSGMLPVLEPAGLAMRLVDPPAATVRGSWSRPSKAMKQWLNKRLALQARGRTGLRTNDLLVSVHDLDHGGPYDATTYAGLLQGIPDDTVVEVMVHPYILGEDVLALYAETMEAKRPFLQRCVSEYEALRGAPVFKDSLQVDYGRI